MRFTTILYNKQRFFFYTLLICCISDIGFAQTVQKPVIVQQTQKVQLIGNQIFYLEDTEGKLKLEDILASNNQQKFQPHTQLIFNRPPTNNVFWFKFQIQNKRVGNRNDDLQPLSALCYQRPFVSHLFCLFSLTSFYCSVC